MTINTPWNEVCIYVFEKCSKKYNKIKKLYLLMNNVYFILYYIKKEQHYKIVTDLKIVSVSIWIFHHFSTFGFLCMNIEITIKCNEIVKKN